VADRGLKGYLTSKLAGFTLFVPEDSVTNIAWSVNETLQSILSGGITAPPTIYYFEGLRTPSPTGRGPIVDAQGRVLRSVSADERDTEGGHIILRSARRELWPHRPCHHTR
jgi:hypothetical protein